MVNEFVFHIRNAHPGDMIAALAALDSAPYLNTISDIVAQAESLGYSIRDRQRFEALMTARDLGLVDKEQNSLTDKGRVIREIEMKNPDLFVDIIHGLQYRLWDTRNPQANCFSWTYRALCKMLWVSGTSETSNRRDIASKIETEAREIFARDDISLSPKSIGGGLLWLYELRPTVFNDGETFCRRHFCPPELFLLALDFIYNQDGSDYGSNLLLNDDKRDKICTACLLEPSGFERVLNYSVAQFDYLGKGIGGGWGHYLTLRRRPELTDFA